MILLTSLIALFAGYCLGYYRGAKTNIDLFIFDEEQYQKELDDKLKYTK